MTAAQYDAVLGAWCHLKIGIENALRDGDRFWARYLAAKARALHQAFPFDERMKAIHEHIYQRERPASLAGTPIPE